MRVPGLDERDPQVLAQAIRELATGSTNAAAGPIALSTGTTTTVVTDPLCTASSRVFLSPLTANAAATQAYIAAVAQGSFTVGHLNAATTDRTFAYEIRRRS